MSEPKTWKNMGARFTTSDGEVIERYDTFEAPESSRDVRMRRRKLRPVGPETESVEPADVRFPGIDFGSKRAYEIARDAEPSVTAKELEGIEGAGEDGALLASDVREFLEGR